MIFLSYSHKDKAIVNSGILCIYAEEDVKKHDQRNHTKLIAVEFASTAFFYPLKRTS